MISASYAFGSIDPMTDADVSHLAANLREIDVLELQKWMGISAEAGLRLSLRNSKFALCLRDRDGFPVSALGIGWLPYPRAGIAWFLSSDRIDLVGLFFLQECRSLIADFMQGHDVISNYVYSGNETSIKWLKWLGFEILSETTTPHSGGDVFYEMAKFKDRNVRDLYVERDWQRFARSQRFAYGNAKLVDNVVSD